MDRERAARLDRYIGTLREGRMEERGTFIRPGGGRDEGESRDNRPGGYGECDSIQAGWFRGPWSGGCFRDQVGRAAVNPLMTEYP